MQSGDLFIGVFIRHQKIGRTFIEWPLHVTIVSWARGAAEPQVLLAALDRELRSTKAFSVKVGPETLFSDGRVLVNEITDAKSLHNFIDIYEKVKEVENKLGYRFVSTLHPRYRPHVTVQSLDRLHSGDEFDVRSLAVIEQKGNHKEIIGEVGLRA